MEAFRLFGTTHVMTLMRWAGILSALGLGWIWQARTGIGTAKITDGVFVSAKDPRCMRHGRTKLIQSEPHHELIPGVARRRPSFLLYWFLRRFDPCAEGVYSDAILS